MEKTTVNGYIAEPGNDGFKHHFGPGSWVVRAPIGAAPAPRVILVLDCSDPRVGMPADCGELPICSRIDEESPDVQVYKFDARSNVVTFEGQPWLAELAPADVLPQLVTCELRLRPLDESEDPEKSDEYSVQDTFIGGDSFLRIRGIPLWIGDAQEVRCTCGRDSEFVAAVGYESYDSRSKFTIDGTAFFLGEVALYFFACPPCGRVSVISQST